MTCESAKANEDDQLELEWFSVSTDPVDLESAKFLRRFKDTELSRHSMQKSLFLVFQRDLACFGCQMDEYLSFTADSDKPVLMTVYVAKLDSTGLLEPRRYQRSSIHEFIRLLFSRYQSYCDNLSIPLRFHVYARSSPEYLFPDSQKLITLKHVLSGRKLVYWWKHTLEAIFPSSPNLNMYWTIPGIELNELPREHRLSDRWKYSYPSGDSSALETIPLFYDDSKSSYISRSIVEDASITVDRFINDMLSRASDFQNSEAALFVIEYYSTDKSPAKKDNPKELSGSDFKIPSSYSSNELFSEMENLLNLGATSFREYCRFSSNAIAEKSSGRLLNCFKSYPECLAQKLTVILKSNDKGEKRKVEEAKQASVVNVLTVKKRRVQK